MLQSTTSSISSLSVVQVGTLPPLPDWWKSISSNTFVLNMITAHHLQLRCNPLLFHNYKWLNIKATFAQHSFIWKEVDELLAKGATETSTGGAGFYSNVFVASNVSVGINHT